MNPLFLFDIDGTLVRMAGAGSRAMSRVFEDLHGVPDAFRAIDFRGGLDPMLVRQAWALHGVVERDGDMDRFRGLFCRVLEELVTIGHPRQMACPGVVPLLETLAPRGPLGLVTGNWREGACTKLTAFDLWRHFEAFRFLGAFGDDGRVRSDLVPVALQRAFEQGYSADRVLLFGDTPQDVAAARAGGALSVAVMTGWCTRAELEDANPDLLVEDFISGAEAILGLIS